MKKSLILFSLCFVYFNVNAQEIKFGKVSLDELKEAYYPKDSATSATILYKNIRVYYDYTESEGFKLTTQIHERIKIYNNEGLEWAEKIINTFKDNNLRETVNIKGYTYNLVDGKIVEEKLKSNQIFKEEVDENWTQNKFAMPNAQKGSVVEWYYTISSPFAGNIDDVVFQYRIPIKKMIAKIEIPQYFTFKYLPNSYYPIKMSQNQQNRTLEYSYRTDDGTGAKTTLHRSTENIFVNIYEANENFIPAIKEEPYINDINNYIAKVHFEHISTQFTNRAPKFYSTDWESVAKTINKNYYFGKQLEGTNFLKTDAITQTANAKTDDEKAAILFNFLKTQIKWNGNYSKYAEKGIKKAYQEHVGNAADINLCLVALFREAGLNANPVLISTRNHGVPLFPTINGFNYVIAAIESPSGILLFDATELYSTANVLPSRVLNWEGRLVRADDTFAVVNLNAVEPAKKRINLFVKLDENGKVTGLKRSSFYTNNALEYRKDRAFVSETDLLSKLENENRDVEISELKITNKESLSNPIVETFKFESDNLCDIIDSKIYFEPLLFLSQTKNPFSSEKRLYPINFGTAWEDTYIVSIQIPNGYTIATMPQNLAISLPNEVGSFKFSITKKSENKIEAVAITKINTPIIASIYYQELKDFYKQLIEKQTEKIMLTKL